jgi:hypothetical protein
MAKKLTSIKNADESAKKTALRKSASAKKTGKKSAKQPTTGEEPLVKIEVESNLFAEMSAKHGGSIQAIADRLHALVREVLPDASELIYGSEKVGIALYSIGGPSKVICGIQFQEDGCLLYIHNAVGLTHPDLILEGRGGDTRHVKFASLDEIKIEPVKWLIGEGKRLAEK